MHTSPHAPELLHSKNSLARRIVEDADASFRDLVTRAGALLVEPGDRIVMKHDPT